MKNDYFNRSTMFNRMEKNESYLLFSLVKPYKISINFEFKFDQKLIG